MSAGRICNRAVVSVAPEDGVREAARRMEQYNVGTVVVVDRERTPVGILTDRDLALRCVGGEADPDENAVADLMTSPVHTIAEETPIEEALSTMASLGVRRLPVVDEERRLAGILSLDDVIDLLSEEAELIRELLGRHAPDIPIA